MFYVMMNLDGYIAINVLILSMLFLYTENNKEMLRKEFLNKAYGRGIFEEVGRDDPN